MIQSSLIRKISNELFIISMTSKNILKLYLFEFMNNIFCHGLLILEMKLILYNINSLKLYIKVNSIATP